MQKTVVNVVRCQGLNILQQLQAEEVLLRRTKQNWFLMNSGMSGLSIVLGFGGRMQELVDAKRVQDGVSAGKSIELIRRYTGGGTVIVDESTLFASFVMNTEDVPSLPYPRDIMDWTESIYGPVFNGSRGRGRGTGSSGQVPGGAGGGGGGLDGPGAATSQDDAVAGALTSAHFSLRENDYLLGDLKIGGNAQTITKQRWVHHTSFLWDYCENNMQYLLMPKKRPDYRKDRSHGQFLDKLSRHMSEPGEFVERTVRELGKSYDVVEVSEQHMLALVHELQHSVDYEKPADIRTRIEQVDNPSR